MGQHGQALERKRFGRYLRTIREERRLSLDVVEEMSVGFPERITKSHLSRIENGQATPTFTRMFTLSQIYGIPVSSLAEQFEVVLIREMAPKELDEKSEEELLSRARELRVAGRYRESLQIYELILDRVTDRQERGGLEQADLTFSSLNDLLLNDLLLNKTTCLVHLARYLAAKELCENLLSSAALSQKQRVQTLLYFTMCCQRLDKLNLATMVLDEARAAIRGLDSTDALHAHLAALDGQVKHTLGRLDEAARAFQDSLQRFQDGGNRFEACRLRLNLAETLIDQGRLRSARSHVRESLEQARRHGYDRQAALALSALALLSFREGNHEAAEAHSIQSNRLARPREYYSVVFRNCYYLWKIAQVRQDECAVRANEKTLRAYLSRMDDSLPEAVAYRDHLTGGGAGGAAGADSPGGADGSDGSDRPQSRTGGGGR